MTRFLSIRWKLTAWYIAALSVILFVFSGVMMVMMNEQLHRRVDAELREEGKELTEEIGDLRSIEEIESLFRRRYVNHGGFSFQISRTDGTVVCGNPWLRAHSLMDLAAADATSAERLQDVSLGRFGWQRVLVRRFVGPTEPLVIHVVVPYAQTQRGFIEFVKILAVAGGIALMAACAGGLIIARRALAPLERMTRAAERISTENLTMSIEIENPKDELGRLAMTLNETFRRLRESVQRIQRFTSDAAHELRTPLTVLRTRLEVTLRQPDEALERCRDSCQIALTQAEKLTMLIDQLLCLSRQDAGVSKPLFDEVEIKPLLKDVVAVLHTAATTKDVPLILGPFPDAAVFGDDVALSRLFFNLIDNAVKYTPGGGRVEITGSMDESRLRIQVADTGVGIDADHLPKIFDRFYRVDPSRNDQTGGAGLGLAICHSIAKSHDGEISVSSTPGKGSCFTVTLHLIEKPAITDAVMEDQNEQERGETTSGRTSRFVS